MFSKLAFPARGSSKEMPASDPVTMCANARPSMPHSSPFVKMRSTVPKPVAESKKAVTGGRSAEQSRQKVSVSSTYESAIVSQTATEWTRSSPEMTSRVAVSITHFETNAPFRP
jgi:hypothetical protein